MMVPVGIPASTLEEPSRGSKTATYFSPSSMTISWESLVAPPTKSTGTSSSSEAKTPRRPVKRSARFKRSFVITSSFFLVFSLDVDLTLVSQSLAGRKLGSLHQVSHCLAGSVDSTEKSGQFTKLGVQHSNFVHETGQSDSRGVADLVEDRNLGLRSCHGRSVDGGGVQGASTAASSRSGAESIGGRRHHEEGTEREFHCRLSSLSTKEKTTLFKIDPVSLLCVSCCWVGPSKP
mmetsp:Transcript_1853/g.4435  ORF Transcript_1853/g.4435 Transcript_1853/m.4435 type:complete len:234 (+) Transcript_1853:744-1445(+)